MSQTRNELWNELVAEPSRSVLESALPAFISKHRWFAGKTRAIRSVEIVDTFPTPGAIILLVIVRYAAGPAEHYLVPLGVADFDVPASSELNTRFPTLEIHGEFAADRNQKTRVTVHLYDASRDPEVWGFLFALVQRGETIEGRNGVLTARHNAEFDHIAKSDLQDATPHVVRAEQSNSAAVLGSRLIMKMFRKVDVGVNPDLEISQFLTEQAHFRSTPALVGAIEYQNHNRDVMTFAVVGEFVEGSQQAWPYALSEIAKFFKTVASRRDTTPLATEFDSSTHWFDLIDKTPSDLASQTMEPFLSAAGLLGVRTAEMHLALASDRTSIVFAPEPFTMSDQESILHSMCDHASRVLDMLPERIAKLSGNAASDAKRVVERKPTILGLFRQIIQRPITALKIRVHGDYHLGQVLHNGRDFSIIDFEGEPLRPIPERRVKRTVLKDVAGMIRSFHYASYAGLLAALESSPDQSDACRRELSQWARFWYVWTSATFLRQYLRTADGSDILPRDREELRVLLNVYVLEKALYELDYEMNNRPDWIEIPLGGVLESIRS